MDIPSEIRAFAEGVGHDDVMSLAEAAKFLPVRKEGKPLHVNTIHRWASGGVRGVVLQTALIGGVRYTTRRAIERFLVRLGCGELCSLKPEGQPRMASVEVLRRSGIADGGEVPGGES